MEVRLKEMGLNPDTISFYSTYNSDTKECEDSNDVEFGECEISGIVGNLVNCCASDTDGEIHNFQAGEWLVGGHLGKLAGAF